MRAKLALLALLAPLLVATGATPAGAHAAGYCGHGTYSHRPWYVPWYTERITFRSSWTTSGGTHWHHVHVKEWASHYDTVYRCIT